MPTTKAMKAASTKRKELPNQSYQNLSGLAIFGNLCFLRELDLGDNISQVR
jgi:hypothetical protein